MVSSSLGGLAPSLAPCACPWPGVGDAPPAWLVLAVLGAVSYSAPGDAASCSSSPSTALRGAERLGGPDPAAGGACFRSEMQIGCSLIRPRWVNTATLSPCADAHVSLSFSDPILQVPVYVAE